MNKVTGIKSVDFKIIALGHGVVNWNGPTTLMGKDGKSVNNHSLPKLRGYTNLTGRVKEENGYKYLKAPTDIDFKENPLYLSQNSFRHHMFKFHAFDMHFATKANLSKVLASITGLIRGYVVPESQNKRTSPLLIEDFVDQLGNGNFEQMGRCGSKATEKNKKGEDASSSFFSKTTFGDTKYISYGSISIEQLQFISLDKKFDREAMEIKEGEGVHLAESITKFIQSLNPETLSELNPKAVFHENYVRGGTIFEEGEVGILLNNDAIHTLVQYTLQLISELTIRQAKSYMYVDSILVDYNDSNKMMRIKHSPEKGICAIPNLKYAKYFYTK